MIFIFISYFFYDWAFNAFNCKWAQVQSQSQQQSNSINEIKTRELNKSRPQSRKERMRPEQRRAEQAAQADILDYY